MHISANIGPKVYILFCLIFSPEFVTFFDFTRYPNVIGDHVTSIIALKTRSIPIAVHLVCLPAYIL